MINQAPTKEFFIVATCHGMSSLDFHSHVVLHCSIAVYPENTGMFFIDILMSATNWDLILCFHPHPDLLPSREKEL